MCILLSQLWDSIAFFLPHGEDCPPFHAINNTTTTTALETGFRLAFTVEQQGEQQIKRAQRGRRDILEQLEEYTPLDLKLQAFTAQYPERQTALPKKVDGELIRLVRVMSETCPDMAETELRLTWTCRQGRGPVLRVNLYFVY